MNQLIEQFRTFYQSLDSRRQRILWASLAMTAACLIAVGVWASLGSYQVVYTTEDAEAMAAAKTSLEERKIPYRLSNDGRTLSVPAEQAGEANVDIASTGNVVGLEIIETISPGTTPRREDWYYQRALQGELTRSLSSLEAVKTCRVHLVLPDDDVFLKSHRQGSASVVLTLKPGKSLSEKQIDGITALVAGAVQGLEPSDVTLTDSAGNMLTRGSEPDAGLATTAGLEERRRAEESTLQQRVERSLAKFLGDAALFDVAVAVELDDTSTDETKTTIDPSSGVPISEQMTEESTRGGQSAGVAGSESNLPERAAPSSSESERTSSQSQTNYEYSRATTRVTRPAGSIKRVSASVNVDESALQALVATSQGERTLASMKEELATSIQASMGFDKARGDSLSVTILPFNKDVAEGAAEVAGVGLNLTQYLPYAVGALALVLAFAFVIRPLMASASRAPAPAVGEVGPDGELIAVAGGDPVEGEISLAERLRHLVDNFEAVDARELNRLVESQTEASTQVLRRWMHSA